MRVLALSDVIKPLPLVSNGLGVPEKVLSARPGDIRALVTATMRGVSYASAHPQAALDTSKKYVPGLDDPKQAADAMAVLQATLPTWQYGTARPGSNDPVTWREMAGFMQTYGLVSGPIDATRAYSNSFLG